MVKEMGYLKVGIKKMKPINFFLKFLFDYFLSFFLLIFLAPVQLFIAIIIYIFDGLPIFFFQIRAGKDGKPFKLVKFRTILTIKKKIIFHR